MRAVTHAANDHDVCCYLTFRHCCDTHTYTHYAHSESTLCVDTKTTNNCVCVCIDRHDRQAVGSSVENATRTNLS